MKYVQITAFLFTTALLLYFSPTVRAQNTAPSVATVDVFKDWNTMRNYMLSQGLDPQGIDWSQIDLLCSGEKLNSGEIAYNKCAYTKSRDWLLYTTDRTQCIAQSRRTYPDSLLTAITETTTERDQNGVYHTFTRTITPASTPQGLDQQRTGVFIDCMIKIGWVDANNWRPGKRNIYCQ